MKFIYNEKNYTLHIKDYCWHTKGNISEYKVFDTENEALAFGGRSLGMCKLCQKKREKMEAKTK